MSFWDKTVQTKVGCSLVSVADVHLGQTIRNRLGLLFCFSCSCHFGIKQFKQKSVALLCRLLMSIWVKPLEIDMGCSVAHVHLGQTKCMNIEPTLMGGLLISCSCCSVAF